MVKHLRMHNIPDGMQRGELLMHLIRVSLGKEPLRPELEPYKDPKRQMRNLVAQKGEKGKIIGRTTVQIHKSGPSDGTWATSKMRRP